MEESLPPGRGLSQTKKRNSFLALASAAEAIRKLFSIVRLKPVELLSLFLHLKLEAI
jgi:hypothetical protein